MSGAQLVASSSGGNGRLTIVPTNCRYESMAELSTTGKPSISKVKLSQVMPMPADLDEQTGDDA